MKRLKNFFEKLGENDLPIMPITLVMTLITIFNLLVLEIPEELKALMAILNGILIVLAVEE